MRGGRSESRGALNRRRRSDSVLMRGLLGVATGLRLPPASTPAQHAQGGKPHTEQRDLTRFRHLLDGCLLLVSAQRINADPELIIIAGRCPKYAVNRVVTEHGCIESQLNDRVLTGQAVACVDVIGVARVLAVAVDFELHIERTEGIQYPVHVRPHRAGDLRIGCLFVFFCVTVVVENIGRPFCAFGDDIAVLAALAAADLDTVKAIPGDDENVAGRVTLKAIVRPLVR